MVEEHKPREAREPQPDGPGPLLERPARAERPHHETLDQQVMDSLTTFQRRFLRHVVEINRYLKVKTVSTLGIHPVELASIFVEPVLTPQVAHLAVF